MAFNYTFSTVFRPLIRPIAWILNMGQTTLPEFPDTTYSVSHWYDYIQSICISKPAARDRYEDPKFLQVRKIRRYKESSSSQHEYVVVEISVKGSYSVYVQLERLRSQDSTDTAQNPHLDHQPGPLRPPLTKIASSSQSRPTSSDSSLKSCPANDEVKVVGGWPTPNSKKESLKDVLVEEVVFKGTSFHDLVIVARTLHDSFPVYRILGTQCFWFANNIIRVLECCDLTARKITVNTSATLNEEPSPEMGGLWHGLRIPHGDEEEVNHMIELYKKQWKEFRSNVGDHKKEVEEVRERAESEAAEAIRRALKAEERVRQLEAQLEPQNTIASRH